ncbi:MAG: hypothetical protein JWN54_750 [Mycobacterium sp.]|nr:hypothetical protein [Mycobacterium sp.]
MWTLPPVAPKSHYRSRKAGALPPVTLFVSP